MYTVARRGTYSFMFFSHPDGTVRISFASCAFPIHLVAFRELASSILYFAFSISDEDRGMLHIAFSHLHSLNYWELPSVAVRSAAFIYILFSNDRHSRWTIVYSLPVTYRHNLCKEKNVTYLRRFSTKQQPKNRCDSTIGKSENRMAHTQIIDCCSLENCFSLASKNSTAYYPECVPRDI